MAIHPIHPHQDVSPQTGHVTESLNNSSTSLPSGAHRISVSLAIPLDEHSTSKKEAPQPASSRNGLSTVHTRQEPIHRDSLKRREALLKGKEGSRRRQRWENDRLLNNPWAQPPLPSDWEVHPTYPRHAVPYYLAPLWDAHQSLRSNTDNGKRDPHNTGSRQPDVKVPKELREKLKKTKAVKGLLQDLEEQVRKFIQQWEERTITRNKEQPHEIDSEDEEIVFVGRNGQMSDMPPSPTYNRRNINKENIQRDKLVFQSLADDHGASFGRWLVHSIATYYDLRTWSITTGEPARREAYVGIKQMQSNGRPPSPVGTLPRPLWCMV